MLLSAIIVQEGLNPIKKAPILIGAMNYLKIALRLQARYKWFTLLNITGLALGMLCSWLIFLYVSSHLDTDRHHEDAERLYRVVLDIQTPAGPIEHEEGTSLPLGHTLQSTYNAVEAAAFCMRFYAAPTITVTTAAGSDHYQEDGIAAYADSTYLQLFHHDFVQGNKHTALTQPKSVVLSQRQAFKYFGRADVVGRTLNINHSIDLTVTGVFATSDDRSDLYFDVLVSLPTLKILSPQYQDQNYTWIGSGKWTFIKLKAGQQPSTLEAQLPTFVAKHLGAEFHHWQFRLQPLAEIHFDTRYDGVVNKPVLWTLVAVALALTGLVCMNYVNLSIAQSGSRAKEIGVRKYLGGSKRQLFIQFMLETAMVVVAAAGLALTAAYILLPFFSLWLQVDLTLTQLASIGKIITILLSCLALIFLAGYYPAVVLSGFNPIRALAGKAGALTGKQQWLQQSLICFQYTVALLFMIATVVMLHQLHFLLQEDRTGVPADAVVTIGLPKADLSRRQAFRDALLSIPGVEGATLQHQGPLAASLDGGFIKYDNRSTWEEFIVRDRWGDDHFIETYKLPLVAGRNIVLQDSITETLVNETLLQKLNITNPHDALGKQIVLDNAGLTATIVGVVQNFHHRSLQHEIEPLAIYPLRAALSQTGIRLSTDRTEATLEAITVAWKNIFPDDVLRISFLDQSIANLYRTERITGKLMTILAVVSAIVCSMGILGLSAYSALRRTREIGIRKVLGASAVDIVVMLGRQYLMLMVVAMMLALPVAYSIMHRWLKGFAYHVPLTWTAFLIPAIVLISATLLLVAGQSLRTARTSPSHSLRYD
ncbi:ABC transporter permease [Fulvivirgaceae bacterium PWU5]|uniref:ABC transporter permease n=1 Tax=Dawidia cretensis TaxID=2782350 RepID=A0AAP2DTN1_9BACT|nr:ABC transporter permease [Dawidia cretensis]MBT1707191.1 ABC transporter permease [Dawidia cretensis]